ncbi:MAG: nucleoside triphosphate pyrophosphohydrolase [Bdellovibrio sp.]|nr:nucleoside triphosphate pyrophosphohydrolase [Bdellovibrio sp.]
MPQPPKNLKDFNSLVQIIADLRGPEGCAWDLQQTHESLVPYAIEETHELAEAIESHDDEHIREELGDVLFQVILHAQLGSERKVFTITDIVQTLSEKLVRRHPHVFSGLKVSGTDEIIENWDKIKKEEALAKNKKSKIINIPEGLPALQRASKIGDKTKKVNFDWTEVKAVLTQLKEEITELEEAMEESVSPESFSHMTHEMGDVLFSAAQLSRHLNIEPETSLREANRRFLVRFEKMFELSGLSLEAFTALPQEEKEEIWGRVKQIVP